MSLDERSNNCVQNVDKENSWKATSRNTDKSSSYFKTLYFDNMEYVELLGRDERGSMLLS